MNHKSIDVSCISDKTVKDTILRSTDEFNYELFSKQVLSECEFMLDVELDAIYDDLAKLRKHGYSQ